ncbi:MAG: hypothetical protein AAFR61_22180 [Bacteroidota bacterium]
MRLMNLFFIRLLGMALLCTTACTGRGDYPDAEVEIPDFNFPGTVVFEQNLSAYGIFRETPADLLPSDGFHLLELSSILFTDYAHKQRLVKVPPGTQINRMSDGSLLYPDGTMLTKTFFYYQDERDRSLGKRIIETRLLIKESGTWNLATYLWNEAQTEAVLTWEGFDTPVNWIAADGTPFSTRYHVPNQNECITCHQSQSKMTPIGPRLRNLNREVVRKGNRLNQLSHLQAEGVLNDFSVSQVAEIVDYADPMVPLADRGRAYLEMNCAHCHHPLGWEASAERDFDFRYETPLDQSGILFGEEEILEAVVDREMPFIGTTLLDQEGVALLIEYIESL